MKRSTQPLPSGSGIGEQARGPEEGELKMVVVGDEVAAVVVAQLQSTRDAAAKTPKQARMP